MGLKYIGYDIKGIQKAIFSVPRLLTIIGGSAQIAEYDNMIELYAKSRDGVYRVFSGGGKGILTAESTEKAEKVIVDLVDRACSLGLSIRLSNSDDLTSAMQEANELYPFIPEELEGHPCEESGLYPVMDGGVHKVIRNRLSLGRKDPVGTSILAFMTINDLIPESVKGKNLVFVKSIDSADSGIGAAGEMLFGTRNRWAVIAMDGNDIGRQFRAYDAECAKRSKGNDNEERMAWVRNVSKTLKYCTKMAFAESLSEAIDDLANEIDFPTYIENGTEFTVLPFRPLILGGDDLLFLAHTSVAIRLVRRIIRNFQRLTNEAEQKNSDFPLWPASGEDGMLTMSAGVVYIGTDYPLHTAIEYADSLLNGAKAAMRVENTLTPSAIDWENITESFIDTPEERRYRELVFIDGDIGDQRIELTCRPYTIDQLEHNLIPLTVKIKDSSRSVMTGLLHCLKMPWSERMLHLSSLARNRKNSWIVDLLDERDPSKPHEGWITKGDVRRTMIPDALLIVEEEHRLRVGREK